MCCMRQTIPLRSLSDFISNEKFFENFQHPLVVLGQAADRQLCLAAQGIAICGRALSPVATLVANYTIPRFTSPNAHTRFGNPWVTKSCHFVQPTHQLSNLVRSITSLRSDYLEAERMSEVQF